MEEHENMSVHNILPQLKSEPSQRSLLFLALVCPRNVYFYPALGILAHLLRMVMESKYYAEGVIGHPNHHLRI